MLRRKRNALVLGVCAAVLYLLHLGWFLLFGPPEWFEGVAERRPEMTSVALGSAFDRYLDEFVRPGGASLSAPGDFETAGVEGQIVREDLVPGAGPAVLQTREEGLDRLYVRRSEFEPWGELELPVGGRVGEARWFRAGDDFRVLLELRHPWWPLGRNYGRFWRALLKPELRPESALFQIDPSGADPLYLFGGRTPLPSPDRGSVAFLRSERRGFHSLHIWRWGLSDSTTVVSLWEADPGSGPSFYWTWSSDSKVLFVRGTARGFKATPARAVQTVRLLYDVEGDRLVELTGQK